MANATSNIITPQPGLVSTNPFLSTAPKTSGTTTSGFAPTTTTSAIAPASASNNYTQTPNPTVTGFSGTSTGGIIPTTSSTQPAKPGIIPLAPTPAATGAGSGGSTGSSSGGVNSYGLNASSPNWYQLQPGESQANYNARVNTSGNIAAAQNNTSANTYNGGTNGNGQTFPGYVSALGTMASQPTQNFTQAQTTAAQAAQDLINSTPEQNANVATATNNLQGLENNYADQTGIIGNSPIGLSEQGGEQGLLNQQYSSKLGAAQTAVSNALAGNAQEQAAFTGAGNVANTTASGATTQQGTQQSGTATAAGLIAPQPGQNPATQTFNPQTGTYSGLAALSAGGNSGQSASQALENLGITLGAEGAGANLVPLQQALDAGQGAAQNITSYLASNPSLNSSSFNVANFAAQWASGQYSGANSAQYQTLGNYLTTFATQMAPLLAPGGTVTDASRALQQSLINGSANGQTISQVLAQLTSEAQSTLANRASGGAGGGTVSGGSSVTSVPGGTNPPATTFSQNFFSS